MAKCIRAYEIINHGMEHLQFFLGCGVIFTEFTEAFTGVGVNAKEAYESAVESLAMSGYDVSKLPTRPRGIRSSDKVPAAYLKQNDNEIYWHVSIRVR